MYESVRECESELLESVSRLPETPVSSLPGLRPRHAPPHLATLPGTALKLPLATHEIEEEAGWGVSGLDSGLRVCPLPTPPRRRREVFATPTWIQMVPGKGASSCAKKAVCDLQTRWETRRGCLRGTKKEGQRTPGTF